MFALRISLICVHISYVHQCTPLYATNDVGNTKANTIIRLKLAYKNFDAIGTRRVKLVQFNFLIFCKSKSLYKDLSKSS